MEGKVKFFNHTKGFGFIKADTEEKEYFVHITSINGGKELNENDKVTFDLEDDDRGQKAVNVSLVEE